MIPTPLFEDKKRNPPHGFPWYHWLLRTYLGRTVVFDAVGIPDDFGALVPAYLPAVLNLKHEGH